MAYLPRTNPHLKAAMARGHLIPLTADSDAHTLDLMAHPEADLDGRFEATCLDTGERLMVNGWLFIITEEA